MASTITAVARYYCAADIANALFKNILLVLGASHQNAEGEGNPSAQFFFTNYTLSANLVDVSNKTTLVTFARQDHQGSTSQSGADSRALKGAEDAISKDYAAEFDAYLRSEIK